MFVRIHYTQDCDPQLVNASNIYGGGYYNAAAAAEVRWNRIQDSQARNPTFDFTTPRYVTAYAESVFPYRFFVDGRNQSGLLNLTVARGFFQDSQFPADFYRRNGSFGLNDIGPDIDLLGQAHPISPGHNEGAGNYVLNPEDSGLSKGVRSFPHFQTIHGVLRKLFCTIL
jgi:unspecific peroxygenase